MRSPGRQFAAAWRRSVQRLQFANLVLIPSLAGLLTGLAAIGFVELVNLAQRLAIGSAGLPIDVLPKLPWYRVAFVPAIGGLLVGLIVRYGGSEAEGHGVPEVIEAVTFGGRVRRRLAFVKSLTSAITIGTGGSVGREGPIVQIGAAVASMVAQALRLSPGQVRILAACGAAGGIAAVFNAPVAGAFFAAEVIARNFAMPAFGPVILCSVMATAVSQAYFGRFPAFVVPPFEVRYSVEYAAYAGLGIICGVIAVAFIWVMDRAEGLFRRLPVPKLVRPAIGGLIVGIIAVFLPSIYGVGYGTMDGVLKGRFPWTLVAILLPIKMLATSVTLASGGSGGVFLPSLYIGALAGDLYGSAAQSLWPGVIAPNSYALVGMAGVVGAATGSPITSIILLLELTADYNVILPVMLVSTLSSMVARAVIEDSIYTINLSRRGLDVRRREDVIMRMHTVGQVMRPAASVIRDTVTLGETLQYFLEHEAVVVPVVDAEGRFVGDISIHDIKDPEVQGLGPLVLARDIAEPNVHTVRADDSLADCMDEFILSDHDELTVVSAERLLLGTVSRRDVLRIYSSELLRREYIGVAGAHDDRSRGSRSFVVARVPAPVSLRGQSLREVNLRARFNLTVVAVAAGAHGEEALPTPEYLLSADDVLVLVGTPADVERFQGET